MKKRIFSVTLSVLMVFSCMSMSVGAVNLSSEKVPSDVVNGYDVNIIPSNVAEILALRFVEANADAGLTASWTEDTVASDVVPMFDENGTPTAFSVELSTNGVDTGYVVISAYPDVESYILEYADAADPLYEDLELAEDEAVVYVAPLTYLKDDGSNVLVGVQGERVTRSNVENEFADLRDAEVLAEKRDAITQIFSQEPVASTMSASANDGTDGYGTIVDPLLYIQAVYGGGTYSAYEWKNILENHTNHRVMDSFNSVHPNFNCGPTAVTNLIETAGNYYNINSIKGKNINTIYSNIESIGVENNWFGLDYIDENGNPVYGTFWVYMDDYIDAALDSYGVSHQNVNTLTSSSLSYSTIKQKIDTNQLCILGVVGHDTYGYHFVYPYAYTRFKSSQTGYYKSFLKVADGWSSNGRYIDMSTIISTSGIISYFYSVAL